MKRVTRVIAGVTVLATCVVPTAAHADEPTPTTPSSSAISSATSSPTLDVPDPLAIAPSAIAELTTLALRYESNVTVAEERRTEATEKTRDADRQRALARAYVSQVVDYAMSPSGDPFAQKLSAFAAAENPEDLITGVFSTEQINDAQEGHLHDAKIAYDAALVLQGRADSATKAAVDAEREAATQLKQLGTLAEQLGLGSSSTPTGLPETHAEQLSWNAQATRSWRAYTRQLKKLKIKVPAAERLRSSDGVTTRTVGSKKVTVLPKQTIAMVNAMVARIGDDYADKSGNGRWSCGGLITVAGGYDLQGTPAQLYARTVKVPRTKIQPGDLIFSANAASGIHHVGVYVGKGSMIDAAATRHQVGVSAVPTDEYAVTRPSLGRGKNVAPPATKTPATTICNATTPAAPTRQPWTFPMKAGSYAISAGFGQSSSLWKTTHTGQDLSAPTGTPIYASRGGAVTLSEVGWAGTLITISHPDGTEERYAHSSQQLVKDGQTVNAGDEIALVGSRGNTTGPHLHFEILVNGEFIDPMPVLVQTLTNEGAGTGWGGYGNGQVPRGVLCDVSDVLLRCDVAQRAQELAKDYAAKFDQPLVLTTGYRDIVGQIERGPEGSLRDIPGTSPFGWATRFTTDSLGKTESAWIAKHAPAHDLKAEGANTWSFAD